MDEMMNEDGFENYPEIDALCALIRDTMPQNYVLMLNLPRYQKARETISLILQSLDDLDLKEEPRIFFDELIGTSLCVELVSHYMSFDDLQLFANALKGVDTMDISPRLDGTVEVGFTFEGVRFLVPTPPSNESTQAQGTET